MQIYGTEVDNQIGASAKEIMTYISEAETAAQEPIAKLKISKDENGKIRLDYEGFPPPPFERIRRITGYLVGTIDRWNNAKKVEEKERVKHDVRVGGNDGQASVDFVFR